jgi:hypothetical protein
MSAIPGRAMRPCLGCPHPYSRSVSRRYVACYPESLSQAPLLAAMAPTYGPLLVRIPATVSLNVADHSLAAITDIDILHRDALLAVLSHLV